VTSGNPRLTPTQRDRHLQCIAGTSRRAWQKASSYNKRASVEASIGRWKQVIGDGLRSRIDERRLTEVNRRLMSSPYAGSGKPSVPMMMRHLPPGSLDPKARKDSLIHAHAAPKE
jgi:hypothetical protein